MNSAPHPNLSKAPARKVGCLISVLALWSSALMAVPNVVGTASIDGKTVAIRFSDAVDPVTAGDPARYTVAGATVTSATMPDDRNVILEVTGLSGSSYTVTGSGIQDTLGQAGNFTRSGSILDLTVHEIGTLAGPSYAYAYSSNAIAFKVDGGALWFQADSSKYVYQTRTGDFDVRVKVNRTEGGNGGSNIALDARESLEPGSRHVAITVYPGVMNWTAFRREVTDGQSSVLNGNWRIGWPVGAAIPDIWLRIRYANNTFQTYGSTNGLNWIQIGDAYTPETPYAAKYIGMAVVGTDLGVPPVVAEFSNFEEFALGNASIAINQQPAPVTTTENHAATFSVKAELLNGPPGLLTYQWLSNGVAIPQALGADYTVRLPKLANSGDEYRVVVAAPGVMSVTSAVAVLTVQADTISPYALSSAGIAGRTIAVKFNEAVDSVTATDVARYSLGASMPIESATLLADQQTVVLGVPNLSGSTFSLVVTGVADLAGNPLNGTVNGTILNFTAVDMGTLVTPSLLYADSPSHVVGRVEGGVIWFAADTGAYLYQTRTNDFDVKVRIDKFQGTLNGNVMLDVRESTAQGSRHIGITVYPTMGNWTSFARDVTDGETGVFQGNWRIGWPAGAAYPNIWMRVKRQGNTFSTYGSVNGLDWTQIGNDYIPSAPMPSTLLVGIASATTDTAVQTFEFSNFGEFSLSGASIQIVQQPVNVSVEEHHPAVFTINAQLINGPASALSYQWQRNGEDIPGATGSSYTIANPTFADQGAQIRVRLSAPGLEPVFSSAVTLAVQTDSTPPLVQSAAGIKDVSIGVRFNELLDPISATDVNSYSLAGATINSATLLPDGRSVVLSVSPLSGTSFTVTATGIKDLAGNSFTGSFNGLVKDYLVLDMGTLNVPSQVCAFTPEDINVTVDGGGIWWYGDSGNFVGRNMTGDFDVRVQVRKVSGGNLNSNMLLDCRESTEQGSRHVAITVYPSQRKWVSFLRASFEGPSAVFPGLWAVDFPAGVDFPNVWLRIKKEGNTFTTYGGTNGLDWVQVGSVYTPPTPYAGTFVAMASAATDAGIPPLWTEFANFGATVSRPQMQITSSGNAVVVTWPTAATGFRLQKSAKLGAEASWSDVSEPVTVNGANNVVTITVTAGASVYRLTQ